METSLCAYYYLVGKPTYTSFFTLYSLVGKTHLLEVKYFVDTHETDLERYL